MIENIKYKAADLAKDLKEPVKDVLDVLGEKFPAKKAQTALTEEELESMKLETKQPANIDFAEGDTVKITDGPLAGYMGKVVEINSDKTKVKVSVDLFMGRETEVDLEIGQVEALD